jgi:hypothetical protein
MHRGGHKVAESWETLSRDGLIYRLTHEIAEIEGKRGGGGWVEADREYVLNLVRDTVQAIDGTRGLAAAEAAEAARLVRPARTAGQAR